MITTLCVSCNRPAPEFDRYQELAAEVLHHIADGVTIIRLVNQGIDAKKKQVPEMATGWVATATSLIHRASDFREQVLLESQRSIHGDCDAWKIPHRRLNALTVELDFMRRDLIGHFVPVWNR